MIDKVLESNAVVFELIDVMSGARAAASHFLVFWAFRTVHNGAAVGVLACSATAIRVINSLPVGAGYVSN